MAYFGVSIRGENFWLEFEGNPTRMSFYTICYVLAENETEAESKAVQMLREDPRFENILNDKSDSPMLFCEDIETVKAFDPSTVVQKGCAFYPQELDS